MALNEDYDIGAAFEAIEDELISSMIRNMERHKVEEVTEGKQWTMWQTEQLKSLAAYRKSNASRFKKKFSSINSKIRSVLEVAKTSGETDQEQAVLKAILKGLPATRTSAGGTAEFFQVNERKLNALISATTSDMEKAETAILRKADDEYRKAIYNAQVYANTGAGTYEKAVDMATKDMLSAGLTCVEYSNGAQHTLEDYADMALRTAAKRAYLQGEGEKRQEWGLHLVIVNKRGSGCPCPKCVPFVGKILIDDVWSGGSKEDGNYPLMSYAVSCGLYHPRCRDSHTTYFPGITTADGSWTQEELKEIGLENKREAREQYATRQAKKYARLAKYSLDPENKANYASKAEQWEKEVAKSSESDTMSLSDEEMGALKKYKSFDSYKINEALRNTDDITSLTEEEQKLVKQLDEALKKVPTYEGDLVRTVNFSDYPNAEEMTEAFVNGLEVGKKKAFGQYISTSKLEGYDENAGVIIRIKNAKRGRDISKIGLDEAEVLYERDTIFEVVSKEKQDGIWYISLKEA